MMPGMAEQLSGFFGSRVGRDGMVYGIGFGVWKLGAISIYGGGGGKHKALDPMLLAKLQEVQGPAQIDVEIEPGILDGRSHSGHGGQVTNSSNVIFIKDICQTHGVRDIHCFQRKQGVAEAASEVGVFSGGIIEIAKIIYTEHPLSISEQGFAEMGADKPCPTGY